MASELQSTDQQLIQLILAGNEETFGELMARYEAAFLRYASSIVHDADDAADVVQDAFIKIYRNLRAFDQRRAFSSWAYRIVRNEGLNWVRAHRRTVVGDAAEAVLNQVRSVSSPILDYLALETAERLEQCFAALPAGYRAPLTLHLRDDLSYHDISQRLSLPIGTVGTRIHRAKRLVQALWQRFDGSWNA
jgi:RNA polymerase sigma-70 factor (ECF subfamily)